MHSGEFLGRESRAVDCANMNRHILAYSTWENADTARLSIFNATVMAAACGETAVNNFCASIESKAVRFRGPVLFAKRLNDQSIRSVKMTAFPIKRGCSQRFGDITRTKAEKIEQEQLKQGLKLREMESIVEIVAFHVPQFNSRVGVTDSGTEGVVEMVFSAEPDCPATPAHSAQMQKLVLDDVTRWRNTRGLLLLTVVLL